MKRVLVATDFSELADRAIEPAAAMARGAEGTLILAHVITSEKPPEPDPNGAYFKVAKSLYDADLEHEEQVTGNLKARAEALEGLSVEHAIGRGGAVQGLLDLARDHRADVIVIASSGRTGLRHLLMGSVAYDLVRTAKLPVFVWKIPDA